MPKFLILCKNHFRLFKYIFTCLVMVNSNNLPECDQRKIKTIVNSMRLKLHRTKFGKRFLIVIFSFQTPTGLHFSQFHHKMYPLILFGEMHLKTLKDNWVSINLYNALLFWSSFRTNNYIAIITVILPLIFNEQRYVHHFSTVLSSYSCSTLVSDKLFIFP